MSSIQTPEVGEKLGRYGLNTDNSIVISSGVMAALGIREARDLDVLVLVDVYEALKASGKFEVGETHGREKLENDDLEVAERWMAAGRIRDFDEIMRETTIIRGVRYITPEFLLEVKRGWLKDDEVRQKDVDDVALIEAYLSKHSG